MAVITPAVLWDVSFQLSFAATLGIMLYAGMFSEWFYPSRRKIFICPQPLERLAGPVGEYFLLTLAAQLTTLPLMIYYFKRLSLTALIANPLILPAQPPADGVGGVIGAQRDGLSTRLVSSWLGQPGLSRLTPSVWWNGWQPLPHGSIPTGQVAFPLILLFYAVLFTVTFARTRIFGTSPRTFTRNPTHLPGDCYSFVVWKAAFNAPDNRLHVTILDVGTGDAVLIQSPSGRSVLINGGPSTDGTFRCPG